MADRSRKGLRTLLSSMLIISSLSLSYDNPDLRSPGRDEDGEAGDKYCPYCYRRLSTLPENLLFCRVDGAIRVDQALDSLPPEP